MSYETWIFLVPVAMFDIVLFNSFCMLLTKQFLYIYVFIFIENAKETRRIEFLLSGKSCLRRIAVILLLTTKFRSFTFLFFLCVEISQEKTVFFFCKQTLCILTFVVALYYRNAKKRIIPAAILVHYSTEHS